MYHGSFERQVAIVTGGGSGIGKGDRADFRRRGCTVVIAGRQAERLQAAAQEMGQDWLEPF